MSTRSRYRSVIEYKAWLTRSLDVLDLEVERITNEDVANGKFLQVIQSSHFQRFIITLLLLHATLIAVFQTGDVSLETGVQWARVVISCVFIVEVTLRIAALSHSSCLSMRSVTFALDVLFVVLGSLANGLWFFVGGLTASDLYLSKGLCVVLSTIIFLLRFLINSAEARKMLLLLKLVIPVIFDLSALFFICLFSFASLGDTMFVASVHNPKGKYFNKNCSFHINR